MPRVITKQDLINKLKELSAEFEVIGHKEITDKGIFYQPLENNIEDLYLGDGFTVESVKKFFFEPSCWVFKYSQENKSVENAAQPERKRIIIGVRPCESRGLVLLDKVFSEDSFYINNRQRSVIVGLACGKPDKTCFCVSMGDSPIGSRGMDAIIFKMDERFIIETITDKGKDIFGSLGNDLDKKEMDVLESYKEKTKEAVERKINIPQNLDSAFENPYWSKISFPCLSCGICTYLCPTCHCFDLADEKRKQLKCYDGCSFADFTRQTSGENPRPTKKERYRQRVFHKFGYFKKNFGEHLCVGCGRCIRHCPVKMDISEIVNKIPVR